MIILIIGGGGEKETPEIFFPLRKDMFLSNACYLDNKNADKAAFVFREPFCSKGCSGS